MLNKNKVVSFWAKTNDEGFPGISVLEHMVIVGCVARSIAAAFPELTDRFDLLSDQAGGLAGLHDIGKISPGFQRKCAAWLEENGLIQIAANGCWDTLMESSHGKVSHAMIQSFLRGKGCSPKTAKFVSAILGGHHGRLNPPNDRGYRPSKGITETQSTIDWQAERESNAEKIWSYFLPEGSAVEVSPESPALWWLAGLTSVADWIGSDERYFPAESSDTCVDIPLTSQKALNEIGLLPPGINKNLSFEELFGFSPNEMQLKSLAYITGPGVYVIEAPMGMGKTEAALGVAYKLLAAGQATGIYFALPTQATSNRIHGRMSDFIRRISPEAPATRLIHGNSWLMQTAPEISPAGTEVKGDSGDDARAGRDWFASSKRALIAPFGVGTIDQALLGVVAAKHFFVRHFALAGKVVILDEVHSYDVYTGTLIDKLITTLEGLGCTVIILSATLTGKRRGQIVSSEDTEIDDENLPYPLISGRRKGEVLEPAPAEPPKSRSVEIKFIDVGNAEQNACSLARKGGTVLWICNTVAAAQEQYAHLIHVTGDEFPIGLLHSRFPFHRREHLETEWMQRFGKDGATRCGSILISTQIVEQSVDLDADLMISELAPTDMLLQRMGRLWRHERERRPVDTARMCILKETNTLERFRSMDALSITKALGPKAYVYAPFVLLRSLAVWNAQTTVSLPAQIRPLIESTYCYREDDPESWQDLYGEWFGTDSAKKMIASRNSNLWQVALEDSEGVQTRLNEIPTVCLVLCCRMRPQTIFIDGTHVVFDPDIYQFAMAQAIQKNLVKIPEHCFDQVVQCKMFERYLYGEQCIGLVNENGRVEVEGLKDGTVLSYSEDLGLVIEKSIS